MNVKVQCLFIYKKISILQPKDWIQWKNSSTVSSKWWHGGAGGSPTQCPVPSQEALSNWQILGERERDREGGEREINFLLVPDKSPTLWLNEQQIVLDGKLTGHKVRWIGKGGVW